MAAQEAKEEATFGHNNSSSKCWESAGGSDVDALQPLEYNDYGWILVHQPKTKLDLTKEVEMVSFPFDNVFDEKSNNIIIYEKAVQRLIPGKFAHKRED